MWIALLICFINENATFIWNYLDIFIMFNGIGLSTHFKMLNIELEQAAIEVKNALIFISIRWSVVTYFYHFLQNLSQDSWMEIRIQYAKLCDLVAIVDKKISHIIISSFLNNLFIICNQLYQSLK